MVLLCGEMGELLSRYNTGEDRSETAAGVDVERTVARNERLLSPAELRLRLGEFYRALDEFNDGYYFEAHETLEDLWRVSPMPERRFFQGVIQLAAACVHVARGECPGALKLLDASAEKVREFEPTFLGVDAAGLTAGIQKARSLLASVRGAEGVRYGFVPRVGFVRPA
jgi:hypothetical protein